MTLDELDRFFIDNKINIDIFGNSITKGKWYVKGYKSEGGSTFTHSIEGDDLFECMLIVAEKFQHVAKTGIPNLLAPQLEYRKADVEIVEVNSTARPSVDDDIPF